MKKYLIIGLFLIILTGCKKEYTMTCSGTVKENDNEYKLNVTIHYDIEDKVSALDYEMIYDNEEAFNKECENKKDSNPQCDNLTIKFTENDEITTSFSKNDVRNMLSVIGASECK